MAEEELRPQHETLQARDKVVLKMTRDGAAEENLTQGSTERISHRPEDAVFQSEENASASEETPASQKPSQQQLYHSETSKVAAPQSSAPPPPSVSFGSVAAQSVVTQKLRKTQAIQGLDADETLEKAAETAASAPVFEEESSGKMRRKLSRSPLFVITAIIRKPKPINPMKRCPSWSMKRRLLIRSFKWRRLFRPTPKQRKAI